MEIHKLRILKSLLLFTIYTLSISSISAQAKEANEKYSSKKKSFKLDPDRMIVGGGFGAQFGNVTLVELSPTVGYLVKDDWLVGIGGRYIYFEERYLTFTYKTNIYGANLFSQYFIFDNYLAHIEYELLNLDDFSIPDTRTNISSFFIGGGYRSMIGDISYFSVLLLYNLNDDINSPYTNPIIRIGFGFGL